MYQYVQFHLFYQILIIYQNIIELHQFHRLFLHLVFRCIYHNRLILLKQKHFKVSKNNHNKSHLVIIELYYGNGSVCIENIVTMLSSFDMIISNRYQFRIMAYTDVNASNDRKAQTVVVLTLFFMSVVGC